MKKPKISYQAIPEQENALGPILFGSLAFLLSNKWGSRWLELR